MQNWKKLNIIDKCDNVLTVIFQYGKYYTYAYIDYTFIFNI